VVCVGSSGQKPRKKHKGQPQHLPKVGTKPNREFEHREKEKVDFHGWPVIIVVVLLALVFIAWLSIT
jgi:hypothetical protein